MQARGSASVLNFNCGIILFSVCRNIITMLRTTFLNRFVPFDKNITFHKAVAWTILGFTLVHVGAHFFNFLGLQKGAGTESDRERGRNMYTCTHTRTHALWPHTSCECYYLCVPSLCVPWRSLTHTSIPSLSLTKVRAVDVCGGRSDGRDQERSALADHGHGLRGCYRDRGW
jgi:hypothetical protein